MGGGGESRCHGLTLNQQDFIVTAGALTSKHVHVQRFTWDCCGRVAFNISPRVGGLSVFGLSEKLERAFIDIFLRWLSQDWTDMLFLVLVQPIDLKKGFGARKEERIIQKCVHFRVCLYSAT